MRLDKSLGKNKDNLKANFIKKLILSYFLVCLVPLVSFIIFALYSSSALFDSVYASNKTSLNSVSMLLDGIFAQNNSLAEDIMFSSSINNIRYNNLRDTTAFYNATNDLRHLLNSDNAIIDAMIFSSDENFYLSSLRWGSLNDIYLRNELGSSLPKEEIDSIFKSNEKSLQVYDISPTSYDGTRIPRLLVIRPLSYAPSISYDNYSLATIIDISAIFPEELYDYQNLIIVNNYNGQVLFDYSGRYETGEYVREIADLSVGKTVVLHNEIATAGKSAQTGLKYVILVDKSTYYNVVYFLIVIALLFFSISIGLSVFYIFHKIKKEWADYEDAISVLGDELDRTQKSKNTYELFRASLLKLKDEQLVMDSIIKEQTESLKNNMVSRLVEKNSVPISKEALEECGIEFISNKFCILLADSNQDNNDVISEKVIQRFTNTENLIFPFSSNHALSFILNINEVFADDSDFYRLLAKEMKTLLSEYPYLIRAGASNVINGIDNIGSGYLDAINVIEYEIRCQSMEFMVYRDVVDLVGKIGFTYTTEDELMLQQAIEEGREIESADIFSNLVERNREMGASPREMRYLLFSIMSTIIRTSNRLQKQYEWYLPPITFDSIIQSDNIAITLSSVKGVMIDLIKSIVEIRSENSDSTNAAYVIYKKALKEIQSSYSDQMFNVSALAEKLNISNVQLSKIFKKYHGTNISEYISTYRIMVAKKLLAEGLSANEIVDKCGFGSLRTFLRLFKNYENVTPGQFRQMRRE